MVQRTMPADRRDPAPKVVLVTPKRTKITSYLGPRLRRDILRVLPDEPTQISQEARLQGSVYRPKCVLTTRLGPLQHFAQIHALWVW